jgi:hypothetical protein
MPEFVLDRGSPEAAREFKALDAFTQGYIEAMFFTSTGTGDDDDLEDATVAELAPDTMARIVADCADFQSSFATYLSDAYYHQTVPYDAERAGADFWFTRNRHGAGFWDRGLGGVGSALTSASYPYGSCDLYRGDDGLLYLM